MNTRFNFLRFSIVLILSSILFGCSTAAYIYQAARGQVELMASARPLKEVIGDTKTSPEIRRKLSLLTEILNYSSEIGLSVGRRYGNYVHWDGEYLVYLVTASEKYSLKAVRWKFPIAGEFPYLGFFEKDDAELKAREFQEKDTYVRGARAYSTLGWFPDPVVSTMMSLSDISFAVMIIHELVHATVFIKGYVEFNEQLASFFSEVAISEWIENGKFSSSDDFKKYKERMKIVREIRKAYAELEKELTILYLKPLSKDQILNKREIIFSRYRKTLANLYRMNGNNISPDKITLNNAVVIANRTYSGNHDILREFFAKCSGDYKSALKNFIKVMGNVAQQSLIAERKPAEILKAHTNCQSL